MRTFFDSIRHAHDAVIRARREQVHKGVQQRKDAERSERAQQKQMHVLQPEGEHDLLDERKCERDVDRRRDERQEEHEQHLRADGRLDLLRRHADLLHDAEAPAVVIALGDLLVVDDEHRRKQEHEPEEKAEE